MVLLSQLVEQLGGSCSGKTACDIRDVHLDSRRVSPGSLFTALRGEKANGYDYVEAALKKGAVAVLSSEQVPSGRVHPDRARESWANWVHPEARRVMGQAAALVHGQPGQDQWVVGITGTNGKTTVATLVHHLLESCGFHPGVVGTVGIDPWMGAKRPSTHTTPDACSLQRLARENLDGGGNAFVIEVSSHALQQERVSGLDFDVAVFTNLTSDHLEYHGGLESYAAAKAKLFSHLKPGGTAVINADDSFGAMMAEAARDHGARVVTYGTRITSDLGAFDLRVGPQGTYLFLQGMGILRTGVNLPLVGRHNVENALASLAVVLSMGASAQHAVRALASAPSPPGRLEPVDVGQRGFQVLVDYAHTPDALERVLVTLRELMGDTGAAGAGRLIVVFGCGGDRDQAKRAPMGRAVGSLADVAVLTSDNPRGEEPAAIARDVHLGLAGGRARVIEELDRRAAIRCALELARPGDLVLVAGKGHELWQESHGQQEPFEDRRVVLEELP